MCRWIAYSGAPIYLEQLITKPVHSLVRQSMNAELYFGKDGSLWSVNADGTGVGWYGSQDEPGLFKDHMPAWSNENLHEICAQVKGHMVMAHVRATTAGLVQRANCHPFKYKNWLFQHNGHVAGYEAIKQELHAQIAPDLYQHIKGSTDSETLFFLALTFGLEENPLEAMRKMVNYVEEVLELRGIKPHMNLSCALGDGKKLYTTRYANGDEANSQFYSTNPECFSDFDPEASSIPGGSTLVVSEPLDRLSDKWTSIPANSFVTIERDKVQVERFI
ncbi:MAG: class II glutamine amidotransferase [Micavibrio sp.]|nr:class II glutamine amidotransferase [Micavibrio sp.]